MPSSTSNSDGAYPAVKTSFFDPETVDRPVPARPWRVILFASLAALIALTALWEVYWRGKGFVGNDFKNSSSLWTQERRKAVGDETVLLGSSRMYYDIDLDIWEELSGIRPLQLSLEGTSPRITLKELAEDDRFTGTVIIGVTKLVFFTQFGGVREDVLDYYTDETPSQRIGHRFSQLPEPFLAFLDEQTRPKRQLTIAKFPLRDGMKPRFDPRKLEVVTADRNAKVWTRIMDEEPYRKEAQDQWLLAFELFAPPPAADGGPPPPMPDAVIDGIISEVSANIEKIRARGGRVAFVQPPYTGPFIDVEDFGFPQERFWDRLLTGTNSVGVTFKDYPEMQGLYLPEWSHLGPQAARDFTRALVPVLYAEMHARDNAIEAE